MFSSSKAPLDLKSSTTSGTTQFISSDVPKPRGKYYIYVLEGKIGRLELGVTPADIIGLCTDNFTTCNILVLISKDKKRYVMIHADRSLNEFRIQQEITWVGKAADKFIVRRKDTTKLHSTEVRNAILSLNTSKTFQEIIIEDKDQKSDNIEVVSIQFSGTKPQTHTRAQAPKEITCHPQAARLLLQHQTEAMFIPNPYLISNTRKNYLTPLLYDGKNWTDYTDFRLCAFANDQLKKHQITSKSSSLAIYSMIQKGTLLKTTNISTAITNTASIYGYFYTILNPSLNPRDFLAKTLNNFKEDLPHLIGFIYDAKVNDFLSRYVNAQNFAELNTVAEAINNSGLLSPTIDILRVQIDVVRAAYEILFDRFNHFVVSSHLSKKLLPATNEAKNALQPQTATAAASQAAAAPAVSSSRAAQEADVKEAVALYREGKYQAALIAFDNFLLKYPSINNASRIICFRNMKKCCLRLNQEDKAKIYEEKEAKLEASTKALKNLNIHHSISAATAANPASAPSAATTTSTSSTTSGASITSLQLKPGTSGYE